MALSTAGVARIFTLLGLPTPDQERLERISQDGRSAGEIRDDLLAWGKSQGEDTYLNMLKSLVDARFDAAGLGEQDDSRLTRIANEIASGERTIDEVSSTIARLGDGGGGTGGGATDPEGVAPPLPGGQTIQVKADGQTRFYQIYEFPPGSGQFVSYQFNDKAQAEAALGSDFDRITRTEAWFNQNVLAEGAFEEVAGQEGTWAGFTSEIMRDAAAAAGVRDPSLAGRLASNPEMQQIMAQAIVGDWTDAQILAEQRKTDFWKNELYPGIENFYTRTDSPERAWKEYQAEVRPALNALGYEPDADGTFNSHLKRMLDSKIDSGTFLRQVPTFIRATQNAEFASVLNQWAQRDLGRNIEFNDWFDLMAGESSPELDDIAEKATLAWAAQNQGSNVSQAQIEDLAARSQLSEQEAVAAFSDFNRSVLALGEAGLSRYGLSRDEVLSVAAGVDPQGDRNIDEAKLLIAKAAREEGLFDDEKINFFTGFTPQGTPERPGLRSLRPEGA